MKRLYDKWWKRVVIVDVKRVEDVDFMAAVSGALTD